ncbi:MAG: RNA polymerase sigma factor [Gemmataceae bacterium]
MAKTGAKSTVEAVAPSLPDPGDTLVTAFNAARDELVSTLVYVLGSRDDALDAVQDAFLKCWKNRNQIADVQNLRAWIFRVALNTAKDLRRSAWSRKSRAFSGEEYAILGREGTPDEGIDDKDALVRIRAALLELRDDEREIFLLRQHGDLTYEQIAELRGAPVGTVKTQMRAALMKLKKALSVDSVTPDTHG